MQTWLLLHGSPDPAYRQASVRMLDGWRRYARDPDAKLCFLEKAEPLLADLLQERKGDEPVCVVPLFLTRGRHLREDIPRLLAGREGTQLAEPLIDAGPLAEVMLAHLQKIAGGVDYLIVYSHGSRGDTVTVAALAEALRVRQSFPVDVVLASDGEQGLGDALARAIAEGANEPAILPHFLLEGHWRQRLQEQLAVLQQNHHFEKVEIAAPLGEHPAMFSLIKQRVSQCRA